MAACVVEEVADQVAQESPVAVQGHRLAGHRRVHPRAFLCHEREQFDRLRLRYSLARLQSACEQQFLDEVIELRDVGCNLGGEFRALLPREELGRHPDAGERSAQLVGSTREHGALPFDEALNPLRRPIEALRQIRDFVAPLDLHAGAQISAAQSLDPVLESFEAPRDPPRERVGSDREADREQPHERKPARAPPRPPLAGVAGHEPAAIREREHQCAAAPETVQEAPAVHVGRRSRDAVGGRGKQRPVGVEECELRLEMGSEFLERARESRSVRARRRERLCRQHARTLEVSRVFLASPVQVPPNRHQHRKHREDADEGEIDAEEEPRLSQSRVLVSM